MKNYLCHSYRALVLSLVMMIPALCSAAHYSADSGQDDNDVPPLFGIMFESAGESGRRVKGLYRVPRNADEEPSLIFSGFDKCIGERLKYCGVYVDGIYYLSYCEESDPSEWGHAHTSDYVPAYYGGIYAVDMRNGAMHHWACPGSSNPNSYANPTGCTSTMAYDKTSGDVYAIGYGGDLDKLRFQTMKLTTAGPTITKIIRTNDYVREYPQSFDYLSNLGCTSDGELFDIGAYIKVNPDTQDFEGYVYYLCSVDKATGKATEVKKIDVPSGGSCVDACLYGDNFYINYSLDGKRYIYSMNVKTLDLKCLYQLPDDAQFSTIFVADDLQGTAVPAACVVSEESLSLPEGSLTGKATLRAPSYLSDGTLGTGPLTVTVKANGKTVGSAQAEWGKTIDIELSFDISGWYDMSAVATNYAGDGFPVELASHVFVGCDTPVAPKPYLTYIGGKLEVKWNPVTEGVNNGVMNLSDIRYSVSEKYGSLIERDITDCSWTAADNLSEISKYNAFSVNTFCGSLVSAAGYTNTVGPNCIKTPYEPDFNAAATRNGWEVFNLNDDGLSWHINRVGLYFGILSPSSDEVKYCNDWAISPAILLQKGMKYIFSCDAEYKYGVPRLGVNLCEAPTPDTKIANITNITAYVPHVTRPDATGSEHLSKTFTVNEDGYYYLGFEMTGSVSYLGISNLKLIADPSGIDTAEADTEAVRAWGAEGTICIDGAEGLGVTIVGIDGSMVFSGQGSSAMRIPASPGIYIVKAGRAARKIIVR